MRQNIEIFEGVRGPEESRFPDAFLFCGEDFSQISLKIGLFFADTGV